MLKILTTFIVLYMSQDSSCASDSAFYDSGKQTWGYEEVRPGANMFWWLYYATGSENYVKKPLVIWLQGGPGASSSGFGNFEEIGPLDLQLKSRYFSWVNQTNVLFIDNPVGTGFSYVNDTSLLARNNTQIANDLVEFTKRFLNKVPEFQTIPLYIFSESYGGKMAVQFALRLHKAILKKKIKCNLKSVSLGDSWISPIDSVLTWSPFLFSTVKNYDKTNSMVDNAGMNAVNESAYNVKRAIDQLKFAEATDLWDKSEAVVSRTTNGVSFYNILQTDEEVSKIYKQDMEKLDRTPQNTVRGGDGKKRGHEHLKRFHSDPLYTLMNGKVKKMLRIVPDNVTWGGQSSLVFDALKDDFMRPVVQIVESLLKYTPVEVNVYNGQLDLIVDVMGTMKWVEGMNWTGIATWKDSKREPIIINNATEIFRKSFKNFAFYWILKAGHMVPQDAPLTSIEMLKLITNKKSTSYFY